MSLYVTDQLSDADAEAFEKHYFGCDPCWTEVQRATEIQAALKGSAAAAPPKPSSQPSAKVVHGPWTNWKWLAVAAAVGATALGAMLVWSGNKQSEIDALARAAGARRTTEARLAGVFAYGHLEPIVRGASESSVPIKLRRVALEAQERAQENPSVENLHAAGVAHLLIDEWDESVTTLEKASKRDPKDARVLSDLAAAYHTRFLRRGRAADLPPAYEAVRQAVDLDPRLGSALYNLALILESLGQKEEARKAWQAYLRVDSTSGWAEEARTREKILSAPPQSELWRRERLRLESSWNPTDADAESLTRRFPQQVRQYLEDELLAQWADESLHDHTSQILAKARTLASNLFRTNGESLALDAIAVIDDEQGRNNDLILRHLRNGHQIFGEARKLYRQAEIAGALERFKLAERQFRVTPSPFFHLARLGQASCHLYGLAAGDARGLVTALLSIGNEQGTSHPALLAQSLWLQGMIDDSDAHPYESLHSYRRALSIFQRLGETENLAGLHGMIAGELRVLGDHNTAWSHNIAEVSNLDDGSAPARITNALGEVFRVALAEGYSRLALLTDDAEVRIAESQGAPLFRAYSRLWRAEAHVRLNLLIAAEKDLASAQSAAGLITDVEARQRAQAAISRLTIALESRRNPAKAITAATLALRFATQVRDHQQLPELFLLRGQLYSRQRDFANAHADFRAGIRETESARSTIPTEDFRISYFETARLLFDEELGLRAAEHDVRGAFEYAERGRARALLDALTPATRTPRSFRHQDFFAGLGGRIASSLSGDAALVEYRILQHSLLLWVVRRGSIDLETVAIDKESLRASVGGALAILTSPRQHVANGQEALARLQRILIQPVSAKLSGAKTLIFVPDSFLHRVPFAGLLEPERDPQMGRDVAVIVAPSAATLLVGHRNRPRNTDRGDSVLLVANPRFSRDLFPDLPNLPGAEAECAAIARLYRHATVLRGADATKDRFLEIARSYSIIHFAGHMLLDHDNPERSALLFASNSATGDKGLLYAHEIAGLPLARTSLVVLSGCTTAAGRLSDTEGVIGPARAFLGAGATAVLATLRPISDGSLTGFMTSFHRHCSDHLAYPLALRRAEADRSIPELLDTPDPRLVLSLFAAQNAAVRKEK